MGPLAVTTMTAFAVERAGTPAALKMELTCAPACAATPPGIVTGLPAGVPLSKI